MSFPPICGMLFIRASVRDGLKENFDKNQEKFLGCRRLSKKLHQKRFYDFCMFSKQAQEFPDRENSCDGNMRGHHRFHLFMQFDMASCST
ncbi:hypothetical protein [Komagataeibacter saccharivorans]|uniref:hypothetical protein n=1 Tax=Komagataeibacter saccharivorans TaxID=265959 RepID=UPI0024A81424|nr:hypothetical protein [Komagataeibacter saccharivorans]